jgi:prepilin-type N-terminal cleavage/methylation domain-containing protein
MSKMVASKAFTVIELLVVVIVVAILAMTTIILYGGIQESTRDESRLTDVKILQKALEQHKYSKGYYPATAASPQVDGWQVNSATEFMPALSGTLGDEAILPPERAGNQYRYRYFAAGTNGCASSLGPYYAIWVEGMETQNAAVRDVGPCTGFTLVNPGTESDYLVLGF